jgi:Flp pilus assembly protein TadG
VLPLLVVSIVALCGFVALAVDVGLLTLSRTQCQNAADAAAAAGARTLDASAAGNVDAATANALAAAAANPILSRPPQAGDVAVQHGAYHYDQASQTFAPQFPPTPPDAYSVTQVTVTRGDGTAFAQVFGLSSYTVSATAIAAHRPRDVCLLLGYSGTTNNESDLWNTDTSLGSLNNTSNNTDTVYPQFGPYDPNFSPLANLLCTSTDPRVGKCNVTAPVGSIPALVNDFYQNSAGSPAVGAFAPAASTATATPAGGDNYLPNLGTPGQAALNINDAITGSGYANFPGYKALTGSNFNGWTQGPGYWGNTFFLWPPDPTRVTDTTTYPTSVYPSGTLDWRRNFFFLSDGVTPNNNNTQLPLANALGKYPDPPGNYVINYKAILAWISKYCVQQTPGDGNPFPPQLRAGNILYYDQIPTDVPASAYDHTQANSQITDPNQRFWKEYIDYVLGVWRDPYGTINHAATPACSIGGEFTSGNSSPGWHVRLSGPDSSSTPDNFGNPFMDPRDNPRRPRHRFWFGPMTMIQFLSDTGLFPGTTHDLSLYSAKLGVAGALNDIKSNHPNDLVSLILYSRPQYDNSPAGTGSFNQAQFALGRDYVGMTNALWFPPNVGPFSPAAGPTLDARPWDSNGSQTPRAHGDYDKSAATSYGLMVAYNQFSSSSLLRGQQVNGQPVGGLGRKGARRMVVLETDGMANEDSVPQVWFTNNGANNSNYEILPGDTVNGGGFNAGNLLEIVQVLCNLPDGTPGNAQPYGVNPGYPGYATANKPVVIHTLAFGVTFESPSPEQVSSVALLQQISQVGGTVFPNSAADPTNGYKWVIGTLQQRQDGLRQAIGKIMDDGITVVLIQ